MDDYISRKAALKVIYTSTAPALEVKAMPAADVVEVRHGRWERLNWGFDYDRCSVCGYEHRYAEQFAYCSSCGAKMDGGQDDV